MARKTKGEGSPKGRGTSMAHERRVVPLPEGDPSGARALLVERRGIRERVTPIMNDPADQFVAYLRSPDHPDNRLERLKEHAAGILEAGGIQSLKLFLRANTERVSVKSGVDFEKTADKLAEIWWEQEMAKGGNVTLRGTAANFLYWAWRFDRLHNKSVGEVKTVGLHFADAWHWLHMEVFGEHAAAYGGVKRKQDLAKSAPARRGRKALSESILEEVYLERRSTTKSPEAFKKASSAAPLILSDVNARLRERDLDEYSELTLSKKLGPIMKRVGR
jgi:hypothetical protein